jgi:chitinase
MSVGPTSNDPSFESYVESWSGESTVMEELKKMNINSSTTIDISFDSFDFTSGNPLPGLQFSATPQGNAQALQDIVSYIHSQGGHVKLSFGGATYPLGPSLQAIGPAKLALDIANVVNTYGLDGVDLDIEDPQSMSSGVVPFIQALAKDMPDKEISLTVPGQDWGAQDWITACAPSVTAINFMEYDIWQGQGAPKGQVNVAQVESDISTYVNEWGIPAGKIHLGLMPGSDDMGAHLTLAQAQQLTEFAKQQGLGGVMIWDANRDFQGLEGNSSLAYTTAIEEILDSSQSK